MARPRNFLVKVGKAQRELSIAPAGENRYLVQGGDGQRTVDAVRIGPGAWSVVIDGEQHRVDIATTSAGKKRACTQGLALDTSATDPRLARLAKVAARSGAQSGETTITASMPGKVVKVLVATGDRVKAGQGVIVVEAMKMENELKAPVDGAVTKLHVAEGAPVESGETLVTIS